MGLLPHPSVGTELLAQNWADKSPISYAREGDPRRWKGYESDSYPIIYARAGDPDQDVTQEVSPDCLRLRIGCTLVDNPLINPLSLVGETFRAMKSLSQNKAILAYQVGKNP